MHSYVCVGLLLCVCVHYYLWIGNGTLCVDHSTCPLIPHNANHSRLIIQVGTHFPAVPTTARVIPCLHKARVEVDTQSPIPILGHIITTIMFSACHT